VFVVIFVKIIEEEVTKAKRGIPDKVKTVSQSLSGASGDHYNHSTENFSGLFFPDLTSLYHVLCKWIYIAQRHNVSNALIIAMMLGNSLDQQKLDPFAFSFC